MLRAKYWRTISGNFMSVRAIFQFLYSVLISRITQFVLLNAYYILFILHIAYCSCCSYCSILHIITIIYNHILLQLYTIIITYYYNYYSNITYCSVLKPTSSFWSIELLIRDAFCILLQKLSGFNNNTNNNSTEPKQPLTIIVKVT